MSAITTNFFEMGKVQPNDQELEQCVLGMAMQSDECRQLMLDMLRKEHFYNDNHITIFEAIHNLFLKRQPVDLLTVANELKRLKKLEIVGGAYYLSILTNRYVPIEHIREHCLILLQQFLRRQTIKISTTTIEKSYDDHYDIIANIDSYIHDMKSLYDHISFGGVESSDKLLIDMMNDIDSKVVAGRSTGIRALDEYIVCIEKGLKYTIGARPGMGKTALAKTIACNLVKQNSPGMVFSMEVTAKQFMTQVVSGECEIDSERIRKRLITESEKELIWHRMKIFRKDLLLIDGKSNCTPSYIAKKVKKAVKDHNIEWFMVDYTQMGTVDNPKGKTKEERIGEFSLNIKNVAKENDVAAFEISQLTKSSDKDSKRPSLGDLKDSGAIEASADCVFLLYRPEAYGMKYIDKEKTRSAEGAAEIIIAKNRQGRVGSVATRFIPQFTKFTDWEQSAEPTTVQEAIDDTDPF